MKTFHRIMILLVLPVLGTVTVKAQEPHLHVSNRWKECSFQLDPSLTQQAWHEFTEEAALVAYFRPVADAKPMGKWKFEVSLLQWQTAIDDHKSAWNDTFVHPDSTHWLKEEGSRLSFPGLTARVGLTKRLDVGIYWSARPKSNYGFYALQMQYNLVNNVNKNLSLSTRANYAALFGPSDFTLTIYGLDLIGSKEFHLPWKRTSIAPYIGVGTYLSNSHETTDAVNLRDEHVLGGQFNVGAVAKLSFFRLGAEYNFSKVSTISLRVGFAF